MEQAPGRSLRRIEMSTDLTRRQWQLLGLVLAVGVVIRLLIAARSTGANDAELWRLFAYNIQERGLAQTYRDAIIFNHPPLMGWASWLSLELAQLLHHRFIYVFKVLPMISEAACAWLLWLCWRKQGQGRAAQVVGLFSLNLVSILISAYHGNTDCLVAMLCLASATAFSREQWLWAGLALGGAINVKVVPLMLLPMFVVMLPSLRALRLFGAALALCALPFVPVLWQAREEVVRNIFAYNSVPARWGIPLLIESTQSSLPRLSSWLSEHYVPNARFVILGLLLLIGWLQRRRGQLSVLETSALGMSLFLVLIPGFGVQYLVWPLPLLFAVSPGVALRFSLYGGAFLSLIYYLFWTGRMPWYSIFTTGFPEPAPYLGLLAWVTLIGFCATSVRKLLGGGLAELVRREQRAGVGVVSGEAAPSPTREPAPALVTAELR